MDTNLTQSLTRLQNCLREHRSLAIFMHANPDPDALAAALLLRAIAKHFKLRCDIILDGIPNQAENHTMIKLLRIPLKPRTQYQGHRYSATALVDCQPSMQNHCFPAGQNPTIVYDHHREKVCYEPASSAHSFWKIDPNAGATASLVMEMYLALKLPLNAQLATAYAYALLSETRYLSREFMPKDIIIYKHIVPSINFTTLASIQNTRRPRAFYSTMKTALACYKLRANVLTCQLGKLPSLDFVHQIAEELAKMEGVTLVIVTGHTGTGAHALGKISLRGEHPALELGRWLKTAMQGFGSGGGHRSIAAGNFTAVNESKLLAFVRRYITRQLTLQLKQKSNARQSFK